MQRQTKIGPNSVHLGSASIIRLGARGIFHVADDLITGQMFLDLGQTVYIAGQWPTF